MATDSSDLFSMPAGSSNDPDEPVVPHRPAPVQDEEPALEEQYSSEPSADPELPLFPAVSTRQVQNPVDLSSEPVAPAVDSAAADSSATDATDAVIPQARSDARETPGPAHADQILDAPQRPPMTNSPQEFSEFPAGHGNAGEQGAQTPASSPVSASPLLSAPPKKNTSSLVVAAVVTIVASSIMGGFFGYLAGVQGRATVDETTASSGPNGPSDPSLIPLLVRGSDQIATVAAQLSPAVVNIVAEGADGIRGEGSGFFVRGDGYLVTNAHVVSMAEDGGDLEVGLADGSRVPGELIGFSNDYDVAVVKIDKKNVPAVKFGASSSVRTGQEVVAIGSPLGLDGTVTSGIISAIERPVTAGAGQEQSFINAIQTDAAINPGNSGGPLVNLDGEVIGVNSAIATNNVSPTGNAGSIGLGFAIPSETVERISSQIIETGRADTPIMGIDIDMVGDGSAGALVAGVTPGSGAEKAGIQAGDILVKIGDKRVTDPTMAVVEIRDYAVGERVPVTVNRSGDERVFMVTLGKAPVR